MDPNHLMTSAIFLLGLAVIFGLRAYVRMRQQQNRARDELQGSADDAGSGGEGNGGA